MRNRIQGSVGRTGKNNQRDVDTLMHLISLHRRRTGLSPIESFKKLKEWNKAERKAQKGAWDEELYLAIEEYQRTALGEAAPSGTINPDGLEIAQLKGSLGTFQENWKYTEPEWLRIATTQKGVHEGRGEHDNHNDILKYLAVAPHLANKAYIKNGVDTGYKMSEVDETAWCACFVKWCLLEAKVKVGGRYSAKAEPWQHFGQATTPKVGAIAVIYRTPFADTSTGWHVGFYIGGPPDAPALLGGNQDNKVGFSQYYDLKQYFYRWPSP